MNGWVNGWMGNKESTYIVLNETIFYSHVITSFLFLYVLKAKANSFAIDELMPIENVAIMYSVLRRDVGE